MGGNSHTRSLHASLARMELDARHAKSMVRTEKEEGMPWRRAARREHPYDLVGMADIEEIGTTRRITPQERMEVKSLVALVDEREIVAGLENARKNTHGGLKMAAYLVPPFATMIAAFVVGGTAGIILAGLGSFGVLFCAYYLNGMGPPMSKSMHLQYIKGYENALQTVKETRELVVRALGIHKDLIGVVQSMPVDLETKGRILHVLSRRKDSLETGRRVCSILEGVKRRGEDLEFYSKMALPRLLQRLEAADALLKEAGKELETGGNTDVENKCLGAADMYESVSDYHMAAEAYVLASGVVEAGQREWAASLSKKAGDCELKAGDERAADVHYKWAESLSGNAVARELPAQGTAAAE